MNSLKMFLLLIIELLLLSCTGQDRTTKEVADFYFQKNITFDKDLKICVILPEVGCGGCIASGVSFFQRNESRFLKSQNERMIIFTAIHSKKMLYRTLEMENLDKYNCHLDEKSEFLVLGNNSIYPLILRLENGIIVKAEYQSPYSENIFGKLELEINNEE